MKNALLILSLTALFGLAPKAKAQCAVCFIPYSQMDNPQAWQQAMNMDMLNLSINSANTMFANQAGAASIVYGMTGSAGIAGSTFNIAALNYNLATQAAYTVYNTNAAPGWQVSYGGYIISDPYAGLPSYLPQYNFYTNQAPVNSLSWVASILASDFTTGSLNPAINGVTNADDIVSVFPDVSGPASSVMTIGPVTNGLPSYSFSPMAFSQLNGLISPTELNAITAINGLNFGANAVNSMSPLLTAAIFMNQNSQLFSIGLNTPLALYASLSTLTSAGAVTPQVNLAGQFTGTVSAQGQALQIIDLGPVQNQLLDLQGFRSIYGTEDVKLFLETDPRNLSVHTSLAINGSVNVRGIEVIADLENAAAAQQVKNAIDKLYSAAPSQIAFLASTGFKVIVAGKSALNPNTPGPVREVAENTALGGEYNNVANTVILNNAKFTVVSYDLVVHEIAHALYAQVVMNKASPFYGTPARTEFINQLASAFVAARNSSATQLGPYSYLSSDPSTPLLTSYSITPTSKSSVYSGIGEYFANGLALLVGGGTTVIGDEFNYGSINYQNFEQMDLNLHSLTRSFLSIQIAPQRNPAAAQ